SRGRFPPCLLHRMVPYHFTVLKHIEQKTFASRIFASRPSWRLKSGKGFTLVELLVVLSIMVVVMSIVFTNQSAFNKTYTLTNAAYDLALTLRGTETFGLGSRAAGTTVNAGYGLHFVSGTPSSFIFFADTSPAGSTGSLNCPSPAVSGTPDCKPGDGVYTSGSDALVQTYTLGNSITIKDFCTYNGTWTCTYAHNGYNAGDTSMDIIFARP